MASREASVDVALPPETMMSVVKTMVQDLGWRIEAYSPEYIRLTQPLLSDGLMGMPGTTHLWFETLDTGSRVRVKFSAIGIGPIVSKKCRDRAERFAAALSNQVLEFLGQVEYLSGAAAGSRQRSTEERLDELRALREKGLITQEEYEERRRDILSQI